MQSIIKTTSQVTLIVTLILFGSGCADFLDEVDPTNITADSYFQTAEHAEVAVNSVYASLRSTLGGAYGGGPWLMVEFATGIADSDLGQADNSNIIRNLDNNPDNGYGLSHWNAKYAGIANANLALSKIPDIVMDEDEKARYLGELKFLRAHYYYQLVRMFGGVPLILEPIDLASPDLFPTQASVEDIYFQIVKDLEDAENAGLPFSDPSGRVSQGAVKTLLSSVYLTMAGYPLQLGATYYDLAANKAKEVIDSGVFQLFDSYDDLHDPAKKNIGENIFMVQYAAFTSPSNWQPHVIPYNMNISAYSAQTGAIYANIDFINAHEEGDLRTEEKEFYYTTFTSKLDRSDTISIGGHFLWKHFDIEANLNTASSDLNWCIHRYAEVLLTYAEAKNETSAGADELAYQGLKDIRARAGLAPYDGLSKEEFREAVWREKWFELSYEGKTWFDMARIRKAFNVLTGEFDEFVGHQFSYGPTLTERELLFPIPTAEILNNTNLIQNPGY